MSDFDGVIFHISTPEAKTKILVSIQIKCYKDLVKYGAEQVLNREYGEYVVPPEPGYDFSVLIDLENLPADKGTSQSDGLLESCWDANGRHELTRCAGRARQQSRAAEAQRHGCTVRACL